MKNIEISLKGITFTSSQDISAPQRVLDMLSKRYESLWPLVGHEYMENVSRTPDKRWPEQTFLPRPISVEILGNVTMGMLSTIDEIEQFLPGDIDQLSMLSAWRMGKNIYQFHPQLLSELMEGGCGTVPPLSVLEKSPDLAVYIPTPGLQVDGMDASGFFACLTPRVMGGPLELMVQLVIRAKTSHDRSLFELYSQAQRAFPGGLSNETMFSLMSNVAVKTEHEVDVLRWSIPLDAKTVSEGVQRDYDRRRVYATLEGGYGKTHLGERLLMHFCESKRDSHDEARAQHYLKISVDLVDRLLAPLMYLCSANAEITRHGLANKSVEIKKTKKGPKIFQADKPTVSDVGYRIGATLQQARKYLAAKSNGDDGGSMLPHVRRAHWHSFWTGERADTENRKLSVKWLPPIPVNLGGEGAPRPVVHAVRPME